MSGQNHHDAAAAFVWCLGIFGDRDQLVNHLLVVGISERIQDLIFDLFILLRVVKAHQGVDRLFASTAAEGADRRLAQLDVVGATSDLQQSCASALAFTLPEAANYRLADFKVLSRIVNLEQSIKSRLARTVRDVRDSVPA